jgi:3-oxoacyl-[acyl-carrier-protein] synthase-3
MVQEALEAKNAAAFDISAGCSGFIYGLSVATDAIKCGRYKNALVIGVERLSSIVNWQDRGTCVLLADGAGAVVLSASKEQGGVISTHVKSDGRYWDLLYSEYGNTYRPEILEDIDLKPLHLKMEGHRLFKRAIACMASITRESLQAASMTSDDIDIVIPHQANIRIIEGLAKNLKIPMAKVFVNIHKYGNTSSGTIPIALDEANRQGLIKAGTNVLLVSFGAGLTWGAGILRWMI